MYIHNALIFDFMVQFALFCRYIIFYLLVFISRFHTTINYILMAVGYAWYSVARFNKTWIGGKILIYYVAFPTRA